jgi:hypothetical protein
MIMTGAALRMGPVPILFVLLALLAAPPGLSGAETPPAGPDVTPEMTVRLTPSIGVAYVSYDQYTAVFFRGEVLLNRQTVVMAVVELCATMDNGWSTTCSPTALVFSYSTYGEFQVTVSVPPRTLASEVGVLTVVAQETTGAVTSRTDAEANVTVFPYHMLRLYYGATSKNVVPGGKVNFSVDVQNLGNEDDSYVLTIWNTDRLMREGWQVEMVQPAVDTIPPNATMRFEVYVTAPREPILPGAWCDVNIEVKSRKSVARAPYASGTVGFRVNLAGNPLEYPLVELIIVAAVLVAAAASLVYWRRWRKRKTRAIDVEEEKR